jgi:hypothetical protein
MTAAEDVMVRAVAVGDTVLFVPAIPSWSKHLSFKVNTKYYSVGKVQQVQGQFVTVADVTGEQYICYTHQLVLLNTCS